MNNIASLLFRKRPPHVTLSLSKDTRSPTSCHPVLVEGQPELAEGLLNPYNMLQLLKHRNECSPLLCQHVFNMQWLLLNDGLRQ